MMRSCVSSAPSRQTPPSTEALQRFHVWINNEYKGVITAASWEAAYHVFERGPGGQFVEFMRAAYGFRCEVEIYRDYHP